VTYRLEFTPSNAISSTGSVVVTWPEQVTIDKNTISCQGTTIKKYSGLCTFNTTNNTLTIKGAFKDVTGGYTGNVVVELFPVTNPVFN
jgi:hypothetical protein